MLHFVRGAFVSNDAVRIHETEARNTNGARHVASMTETRHFPDRIAAISIVECRLITMAAVKLNHS